MASLMENSRDAQTYIYDSETMDFLKGVYLFRKTDGSEIKNVGSEGKAHESFVIEIPAGQYRCGDRFVRVAEEFVKRRFTILPSTVRIVEMYDERDGEARARCVIEEALASATKKQSAFEEASSCERRKISQTTAAAETRKAAKALGGKALTGTAAQKKWAETIRKDALAAVSSDVAEKLLSGKKFQAAKWWIDNRFDAKRSGWLAQQAA